MLNRLSSRLFTQSLRSMAGFNSSWNSSALLTTHCDFHPSLSLSPHVLSPSLTPSFPLWGEFLDRNLLSEWRFLIWLLFLSVVSLSALLTAQEGVYCLLKLSCARNMFTVVMYKKTHKCMHEYTHTRTDTHAYTYTQSLSCADMT